MFWGVFGHCRYAFGPHPCTQAFTFWQLLQQELLLNYCFMCFIAIYYNFYWVWSRHLQKRKWSCFQFICKKCFFFVCLFLMFWWSCWCVSFSNILTFWKKNLVLHVSEHLRTNKACFGVFLGGGGISEALDVMAWSTVMDYWGKMSQLPVTHDNYSYIHCPAFYSFSLCNSFPQV